MRYAFKVAYFGKDFHGSQYQPNVRTVEGEILKALENLGIKTSIRFAGRTDAGVHAFGQVFSFDADEKIFPRILNSELPEDITTWAWAKVGDDFDPRKARSRTYMYIMFGENYDISCMRKAIKLLKGTHNFSNFTKKFGEGENCVRTIYSAEIRADREFIIFEIEGNAFTWNMVRCIISALTEVGKKHRNVEWFEKLLHPEKHKERIEPAPPYGLVLKDVKYDDVEFEVDEYALKTLMTRFSRIIEYHGVIYKLFSLFK
jgi:tRNA pseudouridine38-40 synthase